VTSRAAALCLCALSLGTPASLRADPGGLAGGPRENEGSFAIGPEIGLVVPLSNNRLCPAGYECIAEIGGAVGLGFSYRWANGLGLGFAYEFWWLTANGVYETTVPQSFLGVFRSSFLPGRRTHPLIRFRGGLLLLGPSFRVATLGGMAEIGGGGEVEIGSDAAFSFLVTANLLRTGSFVTSADGATRGVDAALDAMLVLRIGFNFML